MANLDYQPKPVRPPVPVLIRSEPDRSRVSVPRPPLVLELPQSGWAEGRRGDVPWISYRRLGKRILDILLVIAFLPFYLPIIILAAMALFIEGGNPFYRQERLGRDGRRFSILKLRTMVRNADAHLADLLAKDPALRREWTVSQKLKSDPRVTRVGEILRKTSMDELPQLWNVLTGEMSLIGPRPMMTDQLPIYGDPQHYFAMRPGITGLWQVDRRNESSFAERAHYDRAYFNEVSLLRDLRVLWQTIGVVLKRTGC